MTEEAKRVVPKELTQIFHKKNLRCKNWAKSDGFIEGFSSVPYARLDRDLYFEKRTWLGT